MDKNKRFFVAFSIILLTAIIVLINWNAIAKDTEQYDISKLAPSYFDVTENDWIYITALKDKYSYRDKYIEVVLTNDSENPILYGNRFKLETLIDGKWYKVPAKENYAFTLEAMKLDAHSSITLNIFLDYFQCLPGRHRIIKDMTEITASDKSTEISNDKKATSENEISVVVEFNLT